MSAECSIRYIISVNALKEGWDCSFAYVLATIANRTSSVDVEQILGRVLRLPYTKKNSISFFLTIGFHFTQNFLGCRQMWRIRSGYSSDRLYFVCWLSPKFHKGGFWNYRCHPFFSKRPEYLTFPTIIGPPDHIVFCAPLFHAESTTSTCHNNFLPLGKTCLMFDLISGHLQHF